MVKRWEDMTWDELLDAVRREHGWRLSATDEVRRLRALTKEKRDLLAVAEQLQDEVNRLSAQTETFFKGAYEHQLRLKRRVKGRLDIALRGLRTALTWMEDFDKWSPGLAPVDAVGEAWDQATASGEPDEARGVRG
jgi:hypothetical protein